METSENSLYEHVQLLSPVKAFPPAMLLPSPPISPFVLITNCYFGRWLLSADLLKLLPLSSCAVFSRGPKGLTNLLFAVAFLSSSFSILAIREIHPGQAHPVRQWSLRGHFPALGSTSPSSSPSAAAGEGCVVLGLFPCTSQGTCFGEPAKKQNQAGILGWQLSP